MKLARENLVKILTIYRCVNRFPMFEIHCNNIVELKSLSKDKLTIDLGGFTLNRWHISHFSCNSFTKLRYSSFHILASTNKDLNFALLGGQIAYEFLLTHFLYFYF